MDIIAKYFPHLSDVQTAQMLQLRNLYTFWNERINLISRKDIDHLYERHVLHSLAIAKVVQFPDGAHILDVGTGGGFPAIPLAIVFPQCRFTAVDSIGKKIMVVREAAQALNLANVVPIQARAEQLQQNYSYVVSRAVTDLPTFVSWVWSKITRGTEANPHGIFYLKGGDLSEELRGLRQRATEIKISQFYDEPFFETKKVVSILKY